MYYLALIFAGDDGHSFVVPDIPGFTAHSKSRDLEKALADARRILAGHIALMIDEGLELPKARSLTELRSDESLAEDFEEATAAILLPALVPAGRTKRVNVTLDENTLDLIDSSARDRGLTRSAYIAEASRAFATA